MRYSKHLTALYKNEYWLPFPLLSDLYETHLTLDENSLQTMMRDIRAALSPVIIAQPDAFDATLRPEFNVLFTVIPSCSLSILILTLCRPSVRKEGECEHCCYCSPWVLKVQVWGWETPQKGAYETMLETVRQIILRIKLKTIFYQMDQVYEPKTHGEVPFIETDTNVIQWFKCHDVDVTEVKLHALCTPAIFLSLFFTEIEERRFILTLPSSELSEAYKITLPTGSDGRSPDSGPVVRLGDRFYFLYSSADRKVLHLVEITINQKQESREARVTALYSSCTALTDESFINHIPQSLHGGMSNNPPYSGLFMSIRCWSAPTEAEDTRSVDETTAVKTMLLAIARQTRME